MRVLHVCVSCISECEIRLNSERGAGGELQVLGYARFALRYVRVNVCVCVSVGGGGWNCGS